VTSLEKIKTEYQKWQKLQIVSRGIETMSLPIEKMSEDIANQALIIAKMGTEIAVNAIRNIDDDQQSGDEGLDYQLEALTTALKLDSEEIEQEAEYLERYAKLVERAAHDFKGEVERESSSVRYNRIQINEQKNSYTIESF